MASRLGDGSQASEASLISLLLAKGAPPEKVYHTWYIYFCISLNNPSFIRLSCLLANAEIVVFGLWWTRRYVRNTYTVRFPLGCRCAFRFWSCIQVDFEIRRLVGLSFFLAA